MIPMMRTASVVLLCLLAELAAPCFGAETVVPRPADAEFAEYAEMSRIVKPTPAQATALKEKIAARRAALDKFMKDNGAAWQAAATVMPNGKLNPAALEFQQKYDDLAATQESQVMSVLTAEQRLAWERDTLFRRMVQQFTRVEVGHDASGQMAAHATPPTDAQQKIIRTLTDEAAKGIQAMKNPYDPKPRAERIAELTKQIAAELAKSAPAAGGPAETE